MSKRRPPISSRVARKAPGFVYRVTRAAQNQPNHRRDHFRILFDSAPEVLFSCDENGRLLEFNPAAQKVFGYSVEQVRGKPVELLYADQQEARRINESVQATGTFRGTIRSRANDGKTFLAHLEVSKVHDAQGHFVGTMGVCRNLVSHQRAGNGLQESQERFRTAQELSSDAFTILDAVRDEHGTIIDFRWVYANPAAGRFLRQSPEKLVGQRLLDVFPMHATKGDLFALYVKVVETGQPHDTEMPYNAEGIRGWFRNMAVKLGDGIALSFRNITGPKRAESRETALFASQQKSREDLLSLLNHVGEGIIMTDRNGCVTFANQSCVCFLGDRLESVYGRRWTDVYPCTPEDKAALQKMIELPADERINIPVRMRTKQGRAYVTEVRVLDDLRNSGRNMFFFQDQTEVHDPRVLQEQNGTFHGMVGKSQSMQVVYRQIRKLGAVDSTVLIEGETGTGKERVAHAIHAIGARSGKPFLAVNCAGLTESLIASQLFGHKRGAFTGAIADHLGVFEAANGGTVLLDEIGDLPLNMQTTLLRILQEREVTRLGESTARQVDVRVIAATNQNLGQLVKAGRFRRDLLYRIRVARIGLPPLRQNREDIPLLVSAFISQMRQRLKTSAIVVSDKAMERLLRHDWPGNVRELQNAIEVGCIGCRNGVIRPEDLPPEVQDLQSESPPITAHSEGEGKHEVLAAIQAVGGSRTAAARLLGISRATLYRRLQEIQRNSASLIDRSTRYMAEG